MPKILSMIAVVMLSQLVVGCASAGGGAIPAGSDKSAVTANLDMQPSDASIKELLAVTRAHKLLDQMMGRLDSTMESTFQNATKKHPLTPQEQKIFADMREKTVALIKREVSWESLEPEYIEIYKKTFTQKEINEMLAFYKSPAGQAMINKMPLVMSNIMQMEEQKMQDLMPKLEELQRETMEKLKTIGYQ